MGKNVDFLLDRYLSNQSLNRRRMYINEQKKLYECHCIWWQKQVAFIWKTTATFLARHLIKKKNVSWVVDRNLVEHVHSEWLLCQDTCVNVKGNNYIHSLKVLGCVWKLKKKSVYVGWKGSRQVWIQCLCNILSTKVPSSAWLLKAAQSCPWYPTILCKWFGNLWMNKWNECIYKCL